MPRAFWEYAGIVVCIGVIGWVFCIVFKMC
jgi:hypothetical protein